MTRVRITPDKRMAQPTANNSASKRRCRVALLPDAHVRSGGPGLVQPDRPAKRLYGAARWLLETYVARLASAEVDAILLLGDTLDSADRENLSWLRSLRETSDVPIHVIIGNHETYGAISEQGFYRALGLPPDGHYGVDVGGVRFLMLGTPDQARLRPGGPGYQWLANALAETDSDQVVFCCAHFSLLLHPCVQGWRNDGMQVMDESEAVLDLLCRHHNVRAWIAGHKNVPSKLERDGVMHLLSPQLIQAPCGYRILDVYEDGLASCVYDIEEHELAKWSRLAYGDDYPARCGRPEDRDFWWPWPDSR